MAGEYGLILLKSINGGWRLCLLVAQEGHLKTLRFQKLSNFYPLE